MALCANTIQTPPKVAIEARVSRIEISSESNATPPNAAIAGTDSCTVAARVSVIVDRWMGHEVQNKNESGED